MEKQRYRDGIEYKFTFGGVDVAVTFEGLTTEIIDKYNRTCADEKIKAYHSKGENKQ